MSLRTIVGFLIFLCILYLLYLWKTKPKKEIKDRNKAPHEVCPDLIFWEVGDELHIGGNKRQIYSFLSINDEGLIICEELHDRKHLCFNLYEDAVVNLSCAKREIIRLEKDSQEYMEFLRIMGQEYLKIKRSPSD